jgi:hypothetical protein
MVILELIDLHSNEEKLPFSDGCFGFRTSENYAFLEFNDIISGFQNAMNASWSYKVIQNQP